MIKKYRLLLMGLCGYLGSSAQVITPQTINSGGFNSVVNNIYLEGSIGELFMTTLHPASPSNMITQGFLQPAMENVAPPPPPPEALQLGAVGLDNSGSSILVDDILLEFTFGEFMTTARTTGDRMLTQGILQPYLPAESPLPVTGLIFTAQRKNKNQVELAWETLQEMNNRGFTIERKFAGQQLFDSIGFSKSGSPDGNSHFSLKYLYTDNNASNDITYYRLKQQDFDGRFTYSETRLVKGLSTQDPSLKVWPVPNNGNFQIQVPGNAGKTNVSIHTADGKLLRQLQVTNNQPQSISGLQPGLYFLRAGELPVQKIVVE